MSKFAGSVRFLVYTGAVVLKGEEQDIVLSVSLEILKEAVPSTKRFLKDHSESVGLDSLRCCAVFRKLMKTRPKDFLTE
ncbi:unnamed protein product [Vitrella brassicaformis CCMP3155]|uniref:Uncharacterized protein n=1 Tax=Vitrella brassicaformis (strain CCMP3155) TaxID=1169540 RepID=A0A0G4H0L2_VITBC|nr:unnamed protein product [Vitrella brassicaformis CCMP3155]|eukprot:CEM37080.1 unnamed protein product [Vitrella brassicaformis CCMP3155]